MMFRVQRCDTCNRIQKCHCAGDYWICADCESIFIEKSAEEEEE